MWSYNFILSKKVYAVICYYAMLQLHVAAQITPNFTVDNSSGCSPLKVNFTNTTIGQSANATWLWDFGNGNTSTLKNPGAVFIEPKVFSVSLTVTEGAVKSSITLPISVYKKPVVDFSFFPLLGCSPLTISFIANALAGDGSVSNYSWNFGDGTPNVVTNKDTISHSYNDGILPAISLTVTNTFGCASTLTKINRLTLFQKVTASFTASTLAVCSTTDSIQFTNTSTGGGQLSYQWDFGDGSPPATVRSPSHRYANSGFYTPSLTVNSNDGCSATIQGSPINIGKVIVDFALPTLACTNKFIQFTNTSTKPYTKAEWLLDGLPAIGSRSLPDKFDTTLTEPTTHSIKLIVYYGNCTVEAVKTFTVFPSPGLTNFIAERKDSCVFPTTYNFRDTSSESTSWLWQGLRNMDTYGTTPNVAHSYTSGVEEIVTLLAGNVFGCTTLSSKYIYFGKKNLRVIATTPGPYYGCKGFRVGFGANFDSSIRSFNWDFGDGSPLSTDSTPVHQFNVPGNYIVLLIVVTVEGCTEFFTFNQTIVVVEPTNFDFAITSANPVCGNSATTFEALPDLTSGWKYRWFFNDTLLASGFEPSVTVKFRYDTLYTATLIADNNGCSDTVTKTNFVRVLPPFAKIGNSFNTCDEDRSVIRFTEKSIGAQRWSWNFSDGNFENYNSFRDTVRHSFSATSPYEIVLRATNGSCTTSDTLQVFVLLKQAPVLSSTQTSVCTNDIINFQLSNYEPNYENFSRPYAGFYIFNKQYEDLTTCNAELSIFTEFRTWQGQVSGTMKNFDTSKNQLRLITLSTYFNCPDTSNFIPMKVLGPIANFKIENHSGCYNDPLVFTDSSSGSRNVAIVRWEWNFGDGTTKVDTSGGTISHQYKAPGSYLVVLQVTDANGCTSSSRRDTNVVNITGPKADFAATNYTVLVNESVKFYNTSSFIITDTLTGVTPFKWILNDGSFSVLDSFALTFSLPGRYTFSIVTFNPSTGCHDTATKVITVRLANKTFSHSLAYSGANFCVPVTAGFSSIANNVLTVSWNFGDGTIVTNQPNASHIYKEPGIYKVQCFTTFVNSQIDTTEEFVEIKGSIVKLLSNKLFGCNSMDVVFTALNGNAAELNWDFGDGKLFSTTDTVITHSYNKPGIYSPVVISNNTFGCTSSAELIQKLVVDTLNSSFTITSPVLCDSGSNRFISQAISLVNTQIQSPLQYSWIVNEANFTDTTYLQDANYFFSRQGQHRVILNVTTAFGCQQTISKTVEVRQGVQAIIAGPTQLCVGDNAIFSATATSVNPQLQWQWNFSNNSSSALQNPPTQFYNSIGTGQTKLIATDGFCADTVLQPLRVYPLPVISFNPAMPQFCKQDSITIQATGGSTYLWNSAQPIISLNGTAIIAKPLISSYYAVNTIDANGCSNKDSVLVRVIAPFSLVYTSAPFICEGNTLQINVSGAKKYTWINNINGLSNTAISNPFVTPVINSVYTVVGFDEFNCFSDTANISVRVSNLPVVNAGADQLIPGGSSIQLNPAVTGATSYLWSPASYLSCTQCLAPKSTPITDVTYTLSAFNADGCKASDEVAIKLICNRNIVYIPKAFSPNGDGVNDYFLPVANGVKSWPAIIIYDRWGKIVFEKRNVIASDRTNQWDGNNKKGIPMAAGAFIYFITAACDGGALFQYTGTVLLIR